jgi:hypothetical protein
MEFPATVIRLSQTISNNFQSFKFSVTKKLNNNLRKQLDRINLKFFPPVE